jgi:hypothetical protein
MKLWWGLPGLRVTAFGLAGLLVACSASVTAGYYDVDACEATGRYINIIEEVDKADEAVNEERQGTIDEAVELARRSDDAELASVLEEVAESDREVTDMFRSLEGTPPDDWPTEDKAAFEAMSDRHAEALDAAISKCNVIMEQ